MMKCSFFLQKFELKIQKNFFSSESRFEKIIIQNKIFVQYGTLMNGTLLVPTLTNHTKRVKQKLFFENHSLQKRLILILLILLILIHSVIAYRYSTFVFCNTNNVVSAGKNRFQNMYIF